MTLNEFLLQFGSNLSEGISIVGLIVTFLAGIIASAVCPCTLPVGIGVVSATAQSESQSHRKGLLISAAFFLGIVLNLTLLGALAGRLGAVLTESFGRYWTLGMAALSLIAAVVAFFGPRLKVDQLERLRRPGIIGAFIYGFIFSLGTSAAPLLLLLTVAAAQARIEYGFLLAFVFGLGRGFPFLLLGLFAGLLIRFTSLSRWRLPIQILSGCALLTVTVYYFRAFMALI